MENESTNHKSNRKDKAGLVVAGVLAGAVVTSAGCLAYTKFAANNNLGGTPPTQQMQNGMPGGMNGQGGPNGSSNGQGGPGGQSNGQGGPSGNHGTPPNFQNGGGSGGPFNQGGQR